MLNYLKKELNMKIEENNKMENETYRDSNQRIIFIDESGKYLEVKEVIVPREIIKPSGLEIKIPVKFIGKKSTHSLRQNI